MSRRTPNSSLHGHAACGSVAAPSCKAAATLAAIRVLPPPPPPPLLLACEFPREEDSAMAGEAGGAARRRALALAAFRSACRRTGRRAAGLPTT